VDKQTKSKLKKAAEQAYDAIQNILYVIDNDICPECAHEKKACKICRHATFHTHALEVYSYLRDMKELGA